MSLEMRAQCERCQAGLGHGDLVFICSHECTFCPGWRWVSAAPTAAASWCAALAGPRSRMRRRGLALAAAVIGLIGARRGESAIGQLAWPRWTAICGTRFAASAFPGLSVAILRGHRVLLSRGYGFANVELACPPPTAPSTSRARSGNSSPPRSSCSSPTAAGSGLDDPIRRYLSEGPPRWDSVTVRHLLTHTSGIPDYTDAAVDLRRDYTEDQLVRVAAGLPPLSRRGSAGATATPATCCSASIIHRVTGRLLRRPAARADLRSARDAERPDHLRGGHRPQPRRRLPPGGRHAEAIRTGSPPRSTPRPTAHCT